MIEYELLKPIKGSDICDKIIPAFQEFCENNTLEFTKKGFFKTKTERKEQYRLSIDKSFKFQAGDAGPKQIINEMELKFYQQYFNSYGERLSEISISISIIGEKMYDGLNMKLHYEEGLSEDEYPQNLNSTRRHEDLLQKSVEIINKALYGKKEDNATGLDKAQKIL